MVIKQILKANDITLVQLAELLKVSRPTLDNYIKAFENNEKINNELYHKIFHFLFDDPPVSIDEFHLKLTYVGNYYGTSTSFRPNDEKIDSGAEVIEAAQKPREIELYEKYLACRAGKRKTEDLTDKEKKIFSVLFKAEFEIMGGSYHYDADDLSDFIVSCNAHYQEEHPEEYISSYVKTKIDRIVAANKGLTIEQIINMLKEEL